MSENNFTLIQHGEVSQIERHLSFGTDQITLRLSVKTAKGKNATLVDLHEESLRIAIAHLQGLLESKQAAK